MGTGDLWSLYDGKFAVTLSQQSPQGDNCEVLPLSKGRISDANLRMLVNGVTVHQNNDKSLDIHFEMNGDFTNSTMIVLEPMFEETF